MSKPSSDHRVGKRPGVPKSHTNFSHHISHDAQRYRRQGILVRHVIPPAVKVRVEDRRHLLEAGVALFAKPLAVHLLHDGPAQKGNVWCRLPLVHHPVDRLHVARMGLRPHPQLVPRRRLEGVLALARVVALQAPVVDVLDLEVVLRLDVGVVMSDDAEVLRRVG